MIGRTYYLTLIVNLNLENKEKLKNTYLEFVGKREFIHTFMQACILLYLDI